MNTSEEIGCCGTIRLNVQDWGVGLAFEGDRLVELDTSSTTHVSLLPHCRLDHNC